MGSHQCRRSTVPKQDQYMRNRRLSPRVTAGIPKPGRPMLVNQGKVTHGHRRPLADMRAITNQIKNATTIQMLLCTFHEYQHTLNHIHLSACWITLSRLSKRPVERRWLRKNQQTLRPLLQHTVQAARAQEIGAREIANMAYAAARVSKVARRPPLLKQRSCASRWFIPLTSLAK